MERNEEVIEGLTRKQERMIARGKREGLNFEDPNEAVAFMEQQALKEDIESVKRQLDVVNESRRAF